MLLPETIFNSKRRLPLRNSFTASARSRATSQSVKLVTATRAGTLGLRAHGSNRPSAATLAESPQGGAKSASTSPGILLFRCTSNRVFPYTSALNQVSEQIPFVDALRLFQA